MSDPITELHNLLRSQHTRGVVLTVDDSGPQQTVTVQMQYGQIRSDVPVWHMFGFSSHVPLDGAVVQLFQNGADPSDLVAVPPANPAGCRMGGIKSGESVQYDSAGQKVYLKDGKIVAIDALQEMRVAVGGKTILDVTADGVAITGKLVVSDTIVADGDVTGKGISLAGHTHSGVKAGTDSSGKPQ